MIQFADLYKAFDGKPVLTGVTLDVQDGETMVIIGYSGTGKSVALKHVVGLLQPDAGDVIVDGRPVAALDRAGLYGLRRDIGFVFQFAALFDSMSVADNVALGLRRRGLSEDEIAERIREALALVDLTGAEQRMPAELSGGMRKRVGIARAIALRPRYLLYDEPTTGLDPVSRVHVWEMLSKVKQQRDLTVLITTHYMDEADKLCDRVAIVDHGELKALDSPLKLKASIAGKNALEVSFSVVPRGWADSLRALPEVESVEGEDHVFRIASRNGPATTTALVDLAARNGVTVQSLAVQSTSLDDVFVHYTGRALRDAVHDPAPSDQPFMMRR